jgi:hypothetical protein
VIGGEPFFTGALTHLRRLSRLTHVSIGGGVRTKMTAELLTLKEVGPSWP